MQTILVPENLIREQIIALLFLAVPAALPARENMLCVVAPRGEDAVLESLDIY